MTLGHGLTIVEYAPLNHQRSTWLSKSVPTLDPVTPPPPDHPSRQRDEPTWPTQHDWHAKQCAPAAALWKLYAGMWKLTMSMSIFVCWRSPRTRDGIPHARTHARHAELARRRRAVGTAKPKGLGWGSGGWAKPFPRKLPPPGNFRPERGWVGDRRMGQVGNGTRVGPQCVAECTPVRRKARGPSR